MVPLFKLQMCCKGTRLDSGTGPVSVAYLYDFLCFSSEIILTLERLYIEHPDQKSTGRKRKLLLNYISGKDLSRGRKNVLPTTGRFKKACTEYYKFTQEKGILLLSDTKVLVLYA